MVDQPDGRPDPAPAAAGEARKPAPRRSPTAGARRYARALLDVALQAGDPAALRAELGEAAALLEGSPDLHAALTNPGVPVTKKKAIVAAVWGSRAGSPLFQRLMALLAEKDRLALLGGIVDAYGTLWNAHRGTVVAEATTAIPLDSALEGGLRAALLKATGKDVELTTRVDPAVLGGVRVTLGGRTYDGTVASRLAALRERLSGRGPGATAS